MQLWAMCCSGLYNLPPSLPPSLPPFTTKNAPHTHYFSALPFYATVGSVVIFHTYVHFTVRSMESKVLGPDLHTLIALSVTHVIIFLSFTLQFSLSTVTIFFPFLQLSFTPPPFPFPSLLFISFLFSFSALPSLHRDADYDEFEAMLHGLSVSRPLIKAAMGFAFDKVESAKEVMYCHVMSFHVMSCHVMS